MGELRNMTFSTEQVALARVVLADKLKKSLFDFLREFWPIVCDKPLVANWHVEYLCGEAQDLVERIENGEPSLDLVVNIPPGTTKSTIFSVMLPAWLWTRRPSFRVITSSWEDDLAMKSARLSRDIITSPLYKALFPDVVLRADMGAVSRYGTTVGGLRIITSTKASPTGEHADLTIVDDPIGKSQVVSGAMREQATRHMEALSSRRTDKVVSSMIMVMQRLHPEDPTEWLLSHAERVKHICLPAEISAMVKPESLRERYIDGLLDPVRLSREALGRARRELGDNGYGGEFEQDPQLAAGLLLPIAEMLTFDPAESTPSAEDFSIIQVDPADVGGDDFCAAMLRLRGNEVFVDDFICNNRGLAENIPACVAMVERHRPTELRIEGNVGWIQTAYDIEDAVAIKAPSVRVVILKSTTNKEARIGAQGFYVKNCVRFRSDWRERPDYAAAIKSITSYVRGQKNQKDDAMDAVTMAVAYMRDNALL